MREIRDGNFAIVRKRLERVIMMTDDFILAHINLKMNSVCLGECPFVDCLNTNIQIDSGGVARYQMELSWWKDPPLPSVVAGWLVEIGASPNFIHITEVIHNPFNGLLDRVIKTGEKAIWIVSFQWRSKSDDVYERAVKKPVQPDYTSDCTSEDVIF